MQLWPGHRILDLLAIDVPILQAPMAGAALGELAIAVAEAGGLGALACATLGATQIRGEVARFRERTRRPLNLKVIELRRVNRASSVHASRPPLVRPAPRAGGAARPRLRPGRSRPDRHDRRHGQ